MKKSYWDLYIQEIKSSLYIVVIAYAVCLISVVLFLIFDVMATIAIYSIAFLIFAPIWFILLDLLIAYYKFWRQNG